MLVEASTQQSNTALSSLATPATLGALGSTVAKTLNLPPIIGGIAGTVLGGMLGSVLNSFTEQSTPPQQNLCFCHNCYQKFPTHLLH
jgi:ABC-type lipoprotein release transport system permease subunit